MPTDLLRRSEVPSINLQAPEKLQAASSKKVPWKLGGTSITGGARLCRADYRLRMWEEPSWHAKFPRSINLPITSRYRKDTSFDVQTTCKFQVCLHHRGAEIYL